MHLLTIIGNRIDLLMSVYPSAPIEMAIPNVTHCLDNQFRLSFNCGAIANQCIRLLVTLESRVERLNISIPTSLSSIEFKNDLAPLTKPACSS